MVVKLVESCSGVVARKVGERRGELMEYPSGEWVCDRGVDGVDDGSGGGGEEG